MSTIVNDSAVAAAAGIGLGIVVVGGVYYLLPKWHVPSQATTEDTVADILTAPINIAAKVGTRLGDGFMAAAGYEYTPEQLKMTREQLFAEANNPGSPANGAQQLYEIMAVPGKLEQLRQARIDLLGGNDVQWNASVAAAYYPMYSQRLHDAINLYVSANSF